MNKSEIVVTIIILFFSSIAYAGTSPATVNSSLRQGSALMQGYCGRETFRGALANLKIDTTASQTALAELTKQADARKGYNTLPEVKQAAEKAGLQAEGVRYSGNWHSCGRTAQGKGFYRKV